MKFILRTCSIIKLFIILGYNTNCAYSQPNNSKWNRVKAHIFGRNNDIELGFLITGTNFDYRHNNYYSLYSLPWHSFGTTPISLFEQEAFSLRKILPITKNFPYFTHIEYSRKLNEKYHLGLGKYLQGDLVPRLLQVHQVGAIWNRAIEYRFVKIGYILSIKEQMQIKYDLLIGQRKVWQHTTMRAEPLIITPDGQIAYSLLVQDAIYRNFFLSPRLNAQFNFKKSPLHLGLRVNPIFNFGLDHHSLPKYGFNASLYLGINF